MATTTGPCVSLLIPSNTAPDQAPQKVLRLRQAAAQAEKKLVEYGATREQTRQILDGIESATHDLDWEGQSLVVYGAPDFCRAYQLPYAVAESVIVCDRFYIKPLIPALHANRTFYVLALSQKNIRLLRCTRNSSEEVPLAPSVPKNLWDDKQTDQPDHNLETRSGAGVRYGTDTGSEDHLEYLAHFYKHVSEGVAALLNGDGAPLVAAGVDYEVACFRRVNVYAHLVEESVHGSADGLKGPELHKRALEAMTSTFEAPLRTALGRYEQMAGSERASSTVKDIVKAAKEGRVLDLILADGAQYMGVFHETNHDVKGHKQPESGDEDLLNMAALETILHAGQVFVVAPNKVPNGAPAIAVYRY